MKWWVFSLLCVLACGRALAGIDSYEFNDAQEEQRYRVLIEELRCPKCQNQNLAGSDAPIARDLKDKTYLMIRQGKSDDEIKSYLVARYGDFVTYRPPLRASTLFLWMGPFVLLMAVVVLLLRRMSRRTGSAVTLSADEQARLNKLLEDTSRRGD